MRDLSDVQSLYKQLLEAWNHQDAAAFASVFAEEALVIGFDGSQHQGPEGIRSDLERIFADHPTATYISIVRKVQLLSHEVALLHAVVGMVPRGGQDILPAANAVQSLVAVAQEGAWRVALFQNTPAAYHGRPELSAQLSEELRGLLPVPNPATGA
jgi:uncharacterized protein (TIGR02246 family)